MKKIMFSDKYGLTKAVLEGRKTQTRREIPKKELEKVKLFQEEYYNATFDKLEGVVLLTHYFLTERIGKLPYKVGEIVAVAQAYHDCGGLNEKGVPRWGIIAQAVGATNAGWNNKMFVRADLMPHQIRITNVRIERLQDISDEDCLKEGIEKMLTGCEYYQYSFYDNDKSLWHNHKTTREAFAHLIDKVSKKGTWDSNPYVWVYDFELV